MDLVMMDDFQQDRRPRYAPSMTAFRVKKWSTDNGRHSPLIHILDDNSILNISTLSRPALLDGRETDGLQILGEKNGAMMQERRWHKLVQICRRRRLLVLGSAPHLRLSLVCTRGGHIPLPSTSIILTNTGWQFHSR